MQCAQPTTLSPGATGAEVIETSVSKVQGAPYQGQKDGRDMHRGICEEISV